MNKEKVKTINKNINEIYVSKTITLLVPHRKKTVSIEYCVTAIAGTEMVITAQMRSKKYPCVIPRLENISMILSNEFPSRKLLKSISKNEPN